MFDFTYQKLFRSLETYQNIKKYMVQIVFKYNVAIVYSMNHHQNIVRSYDEI